MIEYILDLLLIHSEGSGNSSFGGFGADHPDILRHQVGDVSERVSIDEVVFAHDVYLQKNNQKARQTGFLPE